MISALRPFLKQFNPTFPRKNKNFDALDISSILSLKLFYMAKMKKFLPQKCKALDLLLMSKNNLRFR